MEDTRFALQAYRWKPPSDLGQKSRGGVKRRWSTVIRSETQELYAINMNAEARIRHRETETAMNDLEGRINDRKGWRKWTYEKVAELRNRQQLAFDREADCRTGVREVIQVLLNAVEEELNTMRTLL
ncbi:unnamed protein product [Didymodactylos carnosus]|uniref:Uncharacterized protein n=1 Tax=Didymodactylos carnosus TaxID=1234261 RepID=A0A814NQM9_9BILA|nr:unnamed protein product [Didymodactylos carnosus]CAF3862303.1 unnamed protein product [Didymodactylos carnosus]